MTQQPLTIHTPQPNELADLDALLGAALHFPPGTMRTWIATIGGQHFRIARAAGRLAAGLGLIKMGQWFGGLQVPLVGITAVGVAPEYRGSGVGMALLRAALHEMQAAGVALAALYPASVQFYQRSGFERAGLRMSYRLPLDAIRCREHALDVVRVAPGNYGEVYRAYQQRARQSAGNLERPAWMWQRRLEPEAQPIFRYLVQREGQTEGYVVFTQGRHSDPLSIQDVCVLTPQAGRRVLTLLAGYRSIVEHMTWYGGPCDPLLALFGEPLLAGIQQRAEVTLARDWMLRLVDVAAALTARGYPPGLQGELHLDVCDEVLPNNNGHFVLRVAGGRGAVLPGGAGRVRLGVRELAAIYSGHMAPADLLLSGELDGPASDMALLGALFAGPRPWIADMF